MKLGFPLRRRYNHLRELLRIFSNYIEYLYWLFTSTSKFKRYPKKVKDILIIGGVRLGDAFYTLILIANLIKNNPNKKFYFLVADNLKTSLKFVEDLIDVNILSEEDMADYSFDISLLFSKLTKSHFNLRRFFKSYFDKTCIKPYMNNLGFCVGNDYPGIKDNIAAIFYHTFLNKKAFPRPHITHLLQQQISVCKHAKLKVDELSSNEFNSTLPNIKRKDKIAALINNKDKYFVILHPSGKDFAKLFKEGKTPAPSWPLENFSKIADHIIKKYGHRVVLTGTKEESFIADEIIKHSKYKNKISNFSGKLNIEKLFYLTSLAKLLVSIDTSLVHLASFTQIPIIDLFGPATPNLAGAYIDPKKQINLFHPEVCVNCKRKTKCCPEEYNICMKAITVNEVKVAADKLLRL